MLNFAHNNFLLSTLLLGVYTVIYFGTLYIYSTQKSSQHRVVVGTISLSYLTCVTQNGVQWYCAKHAFVDNGETPETVFIALYWNHTEWDFFIRDICYFLLAALADGLLIWRCFNVWNRSFGAISLPLFLLCCEIGFSLSLIVIACTNDLKPSVSLDLILNELFAVGTFMILATTLSATLLISYHIYFFSKQGLARGSRIRLKHILEILVQSAAAYSVVTFASAIAWVILVTNNNTAPLAMAQGYTCAFYLFTAGVAPTIMVARVVIANDTNGGNSVVTHISGLQFHGQSTIPNATQFRMDSIQIEIGDPL